MSNAVPPNANEIRRFRLFLGCFLALVATSVGFAIRADLLEVWGQLFNLSEEQKGTIQGAGLYPFAISIILFSLIVDRIGYGLSMVFAFVLHVGSVVLTLFTPMIAGDSPQLAYGMIYTGTFLFALGNGIVEAVINPVVATIYEKNKTHWLNILHAGWPGGLVLGSVLAVVFGSNEKFLGLPGHMWQWKLGLVLIPMVLYGLILLGLRFPQQERVAAGVSYKEMLQEFGAGSFFIVCFLLIFGIDQILRVAQTNLETVLGLQQTVAQWSATLGEFWARTALFALVALVPTVLFALYVLRFGRPMFVFLLLVMFLLATTELGTDSWITDIMKSVLQSDVAGPLVLAYTSIIMFVLRFFAGPIVHRISPLGLLAASAAIACAGLLWLSMAGQTLAMVFLAATCYGLGKTFFWPTTLGVVSEQYPKGGALMLNAIAGVGMISVGVLGSPIIGAVQDQRLEQLLRQEAPELHRRLTVVKKGMFGEATALDQEKVQQLQARAATTQLAQQFLAKLQQLRIQARAAAEELDKQLLKKLQQLRIQARAATNEQAKQRLEKLQQLRIQARAAAEELDEQLLEKLQQLRIQARAATDQLAQLFLEKLQQLRIQARQATLAKIAVLPAIMFICYVLLIFYFRAKGGYRPQTLLAREGEAAAAVEY